MACDCGGGIAHPINPTERDQDRGRDRLTVTGLILTPQAQSPNLGRLRLLDSRQVILPAQFWGCGPPIALLSNGRTYFEEDTMKRTALLAAATLACALTAGHWAWAQQSTVGRHSSMLREEY
jgi:hypothetical protein